MNYDKEFDASGLACPLPIVKTKKSLADMASGQVLRVVATDPGSVCRHGGLCRADRQRAAAIRARENKQVRLLPEEGLSARPPHSKATMATKKMAIIATKGALDMAYPPLILASTAAALGWDVQIFFTFYGLQLLRKDLSGITISPLANPAMPMPVPMPVIVSDAAGHGSDGHHR